MTRTDPLALFAALILALLVTPAAAQLQVDITRGQVAPLPIAITEFVGTAQAETAR